MSRYLKQTRILVAVDCIIFGFDGQELKLLLIQRGLEPLKGRWSLVGGFLKENESLEDGAAHVLQQLTGLQGVYMEQLYAFSKPDRDSVERTISVAYFALIDLDQYRQQLSEEYHAEWVSLRGLPDLIFDHKEMVAEAKKRLRYKAALHPILFELLPDKFTVPQLQNLYEGVYDSLFDKRNFSRKVLSTGLLVKQKSKDKLNSKKGAFYYKLDKRKYNAKFHSFLNFIPNPNKF
ncbi:NUDIX hydrolase [Deminuibacter soli]|uniref:NUDIX hydrolase n=1 Tax=Deminuibacter soli TaxID=2291815 RepID=A0A3E1NK60_9BACT|nr:NUDIX domain-containing protein [Deminuibacter soli]RFM28326.1 NUDIX hydrolase [Deminuibacter soli]